MPSIKSQLQESISLYPAIFVVIALMGGSLVGIYSSPVLSISIFSLIIIAFVIIVVFRKRYSQLSFISFLLLILGVGILRGYFAEKEPHIISDNISEIDLRINEIVDGDYSMRIRGNIISSYDSLNNTQIYDYNQEVIISIQGTDYSLKPGTVIHIPNKLKLIENQGNPDEFDYKAYINRQGIFYNGFYRDKEYSVIDYTPTLLNKLTQIKMWLNKKILISDLSPDSKYFLSAVLIGDRTNLSIDMRNLYSNIGIAHVLALSGLHVGIISLLVYFLLFPLDYIIDRRFRLIISVFLLIVYAFITGLSVSVVRATLIALVCGIGYCIRRKVSPVNLLAFVAIVMILINPRWLYDVGFQLSFMAVLFILLLANKINPINRKKALLYSVISLLCVSISASLGTFMLSAYYFHVIPLIFLIPNVIIIPILPLLLCLGIIAVITGFNPIIHLFDWSYSLLNNFFEILSSFKYSYIDNVDISILDLLIYYTIIFGGIMLLYGLIKKKKTVSIILFAVFGGWIICQIILKSNYSGLVIMNHYRETPIIVYKENDANLLLPSDSIGTDYISQFKQYNKKFLAKRNINNFTPSDSVLIPDISGAKYFNYNSYRFVIVDGKLTKDTLNIQERMRCNYLIITKNYYASMNRILSKFSPDTIILSGNIYPQRRFKLISQIEDVGIPYFDIKTEGAFMLGE